jgi:hypothetical protein
MPASVIRRFEIRCNLSKAAGLQFGALRQLATPCRHSVHKTLTRLEFDDQEARVCLSRGCSLDVHPLRFPPGRSGVRNQGLDERIKERG